MKTLTKRSVKRQRNPRSYNSCEVATLDYSSEFEDVLSDGFLDELAMAELEDED